jgi:hypothetical protein
VFLLNHVQITRMEKDKLGESLAAGHTAASNTSRDLSDTT